MFDFCSGTKAVKMVGCRDGLTSQTLYLLFVNTVHSFDSGDDDPDALLDRSAQVNRGTRRQSIPVNIQHP